MKVLRLTPEQEVRTRLAFDGYQRVLNQIKQYTLDAGAPKAMKELEAGVQHLETFHLLVESRA